MDERQKVVSLLNLLVILGLFLGTFNVTDPKNVTIPISSPSIQLECDNDLRVNNIDVVIRRSNTTCLTTTTECTLPKDDIEIIKEQCNNQESCEVDVRNITNNHICLQDYGYLSIWYTCRTIIDFSCDFESNLCNWSFGHTYNGFKWKHGLRDNGRNPTVDHTTASTAGKYAYIYASRSQVQDIAILESGLIIATDQQCLSFWYFTTNSRDSVYLYQNEENLYDLSYLEEDKWHHFQIPLEKKPFTSYKLVFQVIRGISGNDFHYGAIVIDDILIRNKKCDASFYKCDFESNSCDWNNDDSNEYAWKNQNGKPQSYNTGPSTDHSTATESGHYMYLDNRLKASSSPEDRIASLQIRNISLHVSGYSCLTFWYHMYNKNGVEGLNVTLDNELVWTKFGNQGEKWKKGTIDLHNRKYSSIKFIGVVGNKWGNDIAIDDISLSEGTCEGLFHHETVCVHLDDTMPKETYCPKNYLDLTNLRLSFDPEKKECSNIYFDTKARILKECENRYNSQKCLFDISTDMNTHPECFQLYEYRIRHTCEDEETTTVTSVITSRGDSSSALESTTFSSFTTSKEGSSTVSVESVTLSRVMKNSSDSATGLVVGLVIGGLLLACAVIFIVVLFRRHTLKSRPREKLRNNLGWNDYIGSQDIVLPQTSNHSSHMQNDGMYDQLESRNTSVHGYESTQINNVQQKYTSVGADNGFVNKEGGHTPTYEVRRDKTFADNHMSNDDEYAIVDPTTETSFNETIDNRTGTADSYMVLDPTETGFNRQIFSNTPVGYEFAKTVKDTENKICDEDQYDISDEGVYDQSGSNRHKESEDNIYNHAVDTIYDSGSHKRNNEGREDTYDHFFGQTTEDDYDISTTAWTHTSCI